MDLAHILSVKSKRVADSKPRLLYLYQESDRKILSELFSSHSIMYVIDDYEEQLREYFAITNPSSASANDFEQKFQKYIAIRGKRILPWRDGTWVYFPWLASLVHVLPEKKFFAVRTARNKQLITDPEQKKFYDAIIGIAGLSVGNSVALSIVLQGGARHIRLADHDRLALSNTNRIRTGIHNLGVRKAEMTAREIYLLNPYAKIELFTEGLNDKNIKRFIAGPPKLDVIIDEIDNLGVKYRIREWAQKKRIPLVMAADNSDNGVVDIERYDRNPHLSFFHGRMGSVSYERLRNLNKMEIGRMIAKHIGAENITMRMQRSFGEIGKTIVSWPQLGGAALLNGAVIAYCVRKIINNQTLETNRAIISLDEVLIPGYQNHRQKKIRARAAKKFKTLLQL